MPANQRGRIRASAARLQSLLTAAQLIQSEPQLISLLAYVMPWLRNAPTVYSCLQEYHARSETNPAVTRMLGSAAKLIGAFDLEQAF